MAFIPKLEIVSISRLSNSLYIKDATPTYSPSNPYGFGVPGGPLTSADIISKNIIISNIPYYQTTAILGTNYIGDIFSVITYLYVVLTMIEGVNNIYALYPQRINYAYTLSSDKLTLTFLGFPNASTFSMFFDGVYAIGNLNVFGNNYTIKTINSTNFSVTLNTAWVESGSADLAKFYIGNVYALVLNIGKKNLCNDIGNMAISNQMCNIDAINNLTTYSLLLKAAGVFFENQEYSKAHNAARLVSTRVPIFQNFVDDPIYNNQIPVI